MENRFTDKQLKEFYAEHDRFLRGIGCRRDNFERKRHYLYERLSNRYYLMFDTAIEENDVEGAADPETVTIFICEVDSPPDHFVNIKNDATQEEVLEFISLLEKFERD